MKAKIKVGFVNYSLDVGGIETLILELCKELVNSEKYLPIVCTFQKNGKLQNEFEELGIPIFIIEKKYGTDWTLPFRLARLFKQLRIDIVHTHNQSPWLYGGIAAKIADLPLVHTEHTTVNYHPYHPKRWERIEWFLSKITNQITTVADSVAKFMVEKEGISPRKIRVIYNGVKTEIYSCQINIQSKKNELAIGNSDIIIGNVARFFPNKDHKTLLKAFKIVTQRISSAKLLIAGDGPLKNELIQMADTLNLNGKVMFLGNRRDIPELLQIFDLFALSSVREGFPIVLLEAMASGLPVVATDVDGNAELVLHDETGLVVPPEGPDALANAIFKILEDKDRAKMMGEKGKSRIKQYFSFEKMVLAYEEVYSLVLKR